MKLRKTMVTAMLVGGCLATMAAGPQADKQPIMPNNGRFGDPTSTANKYQGFIYGIVKEKNPNDLTLSKTKFGVDQAFKLTKKTKFTQDGKASSLDKLKVGEGVYIDVETDKKTGDLIAKKVVSGVDIPSVPTAQ